ncbi:hypothetical protein [Rhodoferax sp.]|uniref:hypothetical protein n=1 Tax=Rhodoferax sp. TaxID=50421 RepID=UPI00285010A5|nr:hypothetical protein [Rhodoferax sp.]MDR3370140.1 hypothetical protein [Rhodoferax sp.]
MTGALTRIWRRTLRRVGSVGIAAAMILLISATLAAWSVRLDREGKSLRNTLQIQAKSPTRPVPIVKAPTLPVEQQIGEFVATFPPVSQTADDLTEVFESAKRRHIQLNRGDYQLKDEAHSALLTLTATFPLTASYAQTKEFAADVLRALPHASMDELSMSRGTATDSALETSIRFSFVYRRP